MIQFFGNTEERKICILKKKRRKAQKSYNKPKTELSVKHAVCAIHVGCAEHSADMYVGADADGNAEQSIEQKDRGRYIGNGKTVRSNQISDKNRIYDRADSCNKRSAYAPYQKMSVCTACKLCIHRLPVIRQ